MKSSKRFKPWAERRRTTRRCRDAEAIGDVVNLGIETYGGIDIVVHNAASRGNITIEDPDFETFAPIDISINGFFHLVKASLPSMKARGGGVYAGVGGMTSTKGAVGRAHVSESGQAALHAG